MAKKRSDIEMVREKLIVAKSELEQAGIKPTISAICKHASISRAHIYKSFHMLVAELRNTTTPRQEKSTLEKLNELRKKNIELTRQNRLLARSCMELKLLCLSLQGKRK